MTSAARDIEGSTAAPRRRRRSGRRGFALPVVAMVALIASFIIVLLLQRSSLIMRAQQRQLDEYSLHHTQAGLTEFLKWFGQAFKPRADVSTDTGVVGFDMQLDGGGHLEVRLFDAQGMPRKRTATEDVRGATIAEVMNAAAVRLAQSEGAEHGANATAPRLRDRGPGRVNINSAPRAVLIAIAESVSKNADGAKFAEAVLEKRRDKPLSKLEELLECTGASRLVSPERDHLDACFSLTCEYWRVEATAFDSLGTKITGAGEQGGYAVGAIAALDPSRSAGYNKDWAILSWGLLRDMPAREQFPRE
ncbi:hypothetical protein BH11PLA1_BH11PLA1_15100 [soil metagenome]